MLNCAESLGCGRASRCGVCHGKFGLVRYYSWRTPLCSKKCVDRFRTRRAELAGLAPNRPRLNDREPSEGSMTISADLTTREIARRAAQSRCFSLRYRLRNSAI